MITLLILLTGIWMLALTWAAMELYSIAVNWLNERAHGLGGSIDVE